MKICGIIVEYNPLTNGHLYHIERARQITNADLLIAVMSGNFTQRGEPAIVDKWQRAQAAVENGVDLVFELPFAFACESADYFAKGAISMLSALHVSDIVFGTESLSEQALRNAWHESQAASYQERLQSLLQDGYSYPEACHLAFAHHPIRLPNDLLGFSYVQEIQRQQAAITVHTIHRQNNYHDSSPSSNSASALRHALKMGQDISALSPMQLTGYLHDRQDLFEPLYQTLTLSQPEDLAAIHLVTEGIEYRMLDKIRLATDMDSFLQLMRTKRYTEARLLRTIVHLLIHDCSPSRDRQSVAYLRLLAASQTGQAALRELKQSATLPIISRFAEIQHPHLDLELAAAKLYALALPVEKRQAEISKEYSQIPYLIKRPTR